MRRGILLFWALCGCAPAAFCPPSEATRVGVLPEELPGTRLPAMNWGMSPTYGLAPGIIYTSTKSEDTELTVTGFGLKAYSTAIRLDEGPIALQPILQRASWWSLHGGPAHLEIDSPTSNEYDGTGFYAEAVMMNQAGFGGRLAYQRLEDEDDNFEWMITSAALLFDYTKGGRITFSFDDDDRDITILGIPIAINTIRYGVEWLHIWQIPAGPVVMLEASAARSEVQKGNVDDHWRERLTIYPMKELGLFVSGSHDRGESPDVDGWGGGIVLDMEQVGLSIEYRRNDVHEGGDDEDILTVRLELRF